MFPAETRILLVDDMTTMRKLVRRCLTDLGFTSVTEADDGETAWPMLESAASTIPFQLIISDWNMPKMQGIQLLKKVRANEALKTVPFIFLTAETEKTQVMDAIQSGATNYISKPFTPQTLKEKLALVHAQVQKK